MKSQVLLLLGGLLMGPVAAADTTRAADRFGYGATVSDAGTDSGRAWALQALQRAREAAAQPARIPVEW